MCSAPLAAPTSTPPLAPGRILLWFTVLSDVTDTRLQAHYRLHVLTEEEREREQRYHFARDSHRYLLTRALLRTVLSRYAPGLAPAQWRFTTNPYGKPAIAPEQAGAVPMSFNLSHAGNLVVLALSQDRDLGVDVEHPATRRASPELAQHYFAPSEAAALASLPAAQQQQRFFEYWTLKEAYVKARGMGLSVPLDSFGFEFSGTDRIRMHAAAHLGDCPSRWRLWQFQVATDHLLALCAQRKEDAASQVDIAFLRTVPLVGDGTVSCVQLRTSA